MLAVLAEARFLLHGWLRSGSCRPARGAVEFLEEALVLWGQRQKIRLVRADSGFFDDRLLSFLEQRHLPYIVVARLTKWIQREARVQNWKAVDDVYAVGEFRVQLWGWGSQRRFVVVRERMREDRHSVDRKLIDPPGYTFRIFVTTCTEAPEQIWRAYNQRSDMENRIGARRPAVSRDRSGSSPAAQGSGASPAFPAASHGNAETVTVASAAATAISRRPSPGSRAPTLQILQAAILAPSSIAEVRLTPANEPQSALL